MGVLVFRVAMSCLQIQGLEKISKQLANEVPKIRKDLQLANEKEMQLGKKSLDQMHKQHELAKSRMKKNEELTALMQKAVECLDEKKTPR